MPLYNTATSWGWPAKALHWLVAALVVGMLGVGIAMVWLVSDLGSKFQLYQLHKSFGVLVFALILAASAGGSSIRWCRRCPRTCGPGSG